MYEWAQNKQKLVRAIQACGETNEQQIKDYYVKLGGLLLDVPAEPVAITPPIEEKTISAEPIKEEPKVEPIIEKPIKKETTMAKKKEKKAKKSKR